MHAARGEILTNARVREILGVDASDARESLKRLRDERLLEQRGQRGGASYRLAGSLRPPAGLRLSAEDWTTSSRGSPPMDRSTTRMSELEHADALAILDRLVRGGRLRRTGERRGTKYHAA